MVGNGKREEERRVLLGNDEEEERRKRTEGWRSSSMKQQGQIEWRWRSRREEEEEKAEWRAEGERGGEKWGRRGRSRKRSWGKWKKVVNKRRKKTGGGYEVWGEQWKTWGGRKREIDRRRGGAGRATSENIGTLKGGGQRGGGEERWKMMEGKGDRVRLEERKREEEEV